VCKTNCTLNIVIPSNVEESKMIKVAQISSVVEKYTEAVYQSM